MALCKVLLVFSCLHAAYSQQTSQPTPYQTLSPPPTYPDGIFYTPDTANTQIFTEGAQINVTWQTTYAAVNLYFIGGGKYDTPVTVASAQAQPWITFKLQCQNNNCNVPYNFRAVDATGSSDAQRSGGFYTGQFWIRPVNTGVTTAVNTLQQTVLASSSFIAGTSASSTGSMLPTSTASTTTTAVSSITTAQATNGLDQGTKVGIGIGVGIGGLILAAIGILLYCVAKRKKEHKAPYPQDPHTDDYAWPGAVPETKRSHPNYEEALSPRSYRQQQTPTKTYSYRSPVEAPSRRDPVELDAP